MTSIALQLQTEYGALLVDTTLSLTFDTHRALLERKAEHFF